MNNKNMEKDPIEIFKLFDRWAESLPKNGQELYSGGSLSRIESQIKQQCLNMETQGLGDNSIVSDTTTETTTVVKQEMVNNAKKAELKPNFLFELKGDNTNASTKENISPFECVYDFCLALEKFCKSKSTPENELDIDKDWKKLLFTCSSHNSERIMWIHLTFQTSNKLKLAWKQVVRRLMANFDDPKRSLSLELTLSKFKFLPEVESIYTANSEFARYADELGDDSKRVVDMYMNGMPPIIKYVLQSTIDYDEATQFRYSLLDVQQRAAVFLTANEGDLIFYSKSAHLAISLEYEKIDTKNCEFHLLADHSTIECPDYNVLKFPYMDFTPLKFDPISTIIATPSFLPMEDIMSNADTQSNQIPVQAVSAPKEVHKLADLGQMDGSVIPQENSSLTTSIASKEQVRDRVVQQDSLVSAASATVGHHHDQVFQREHPTQANTATILSNPQASNTVLMNDLAETQNDCQTEATHLVVKQDDRQIKAIHQAEKERNLQLEATNQPELDTASKSEMPNHFEPNSNAQNLTTEMPPDQTEVAKPMTPSQELVNNTTNAFTTAFYSVSPQKSTESVSTSKIADELQQPSISNSLPTEKKQFSGIFIKSALEGAKDFLETVKNSPLDNHHLHLQPKSTHVMAASAQKKLIVGTTPRPKAVKISVPPKMSQITTQPMATHRALVSPQTISKPKHEPSSYTRRSRSRSNSPSGRSFRQNGFSSRSRSRSSSLDRNYHYLQSHPQRRHPQSSNSPSLRAKSPERGCYIHGLGANHSTKNCRQAQLVIHPRNLYLDPQNSLPPTPTTPTMPTAPEGRMSKRWLRPDGGPNLCIFCGLIFRPGHLAFCTKVSPKKKPKRR